MTGGRFAPELSLTIAGTEVKNDIAALTCDFSVTDQVQGLEVELGNLADKYAALKPFDEIVLALNGTQRLYARADSCNPDYSKAGAKVFRVKGRQIGGSALQDIVASLQFVDETPADIVDGIIASYNASKGTSDPTITISDNLAPTDITMSPRWQRKNYWKMFQELQEALGAPVADGGADEFFDFWIDPATTGNFYFENAGHMDSTIVILDNTEVTKAKRVVDATAVKNDVWVWGNSQAGRIPLDMQLTSLFGDSWTEGNASDYTKGVGGDGEITVEDHNYDLAEQRAIGDACIRIHGKTPSMGASTLWAYWSMKFAHGEAFHTKLDGFTNQDPNDMLNFFNETHMAESMGEVSAASFYLKDCRHPLISPWQFLLEALDVDDNVARSQQITARATGGAWYWPSEEWLHAAISIGPSANWALKTGSSFDWSSVKELRFLIGGQAGWFDFYFDGFVFIKPLVVHAYSTTDGVRKSVHISKDGVSSYASAKMLANALLEQQLMPQVYWDFEAIGRDDIQSGYRFTLGSTELLMREQRWQFVKESGWILTGKAWEKT